MREAKREIGAQKDWNKTAKKIKRSHRKVEGGSQREQEKLPKA